MTSAVREVAHAWIRRELALRSFEHRTPVVGHMVHIVRWADIMIQVVRDADTKI